MKYILALDQGTTSSRAMLVDHEGGVVAQSQSEFRQIYPKPGWIEHDPQDILKSSLYALSTVVRESGISPGEIAALGITNQRETTVVWDKASGKPIYNAVVWQCRRTADICDQLRAEGLEDYIRDRTGLLIDAYFSGTKIQWILDNVQGARELAARGRLLFGNIDTFLTWHLTGGAAHVTDYSNASRTMLFDTEKLQWDPLLCRKLSVPMQMLPKVLPSGSLFGEVAGGIRGIEELAGLPIAALIGDQPSALFGQACFAQGQMKNTYGTGCFFLVNTGARRVVSKHSLVSSVAWGFGGKVCYALEGSVFNAGSVIKWLRDDLKIIATAHECDELAETVEDTGGVYFVPAFTGLGAPYWDMYARGTILGLTRSAGRAQIARAVLEAIAYQVADLLKAVTEDTGLTPSELRVDGGASVSDIMMQFQADLLGVPVNRPQCVESTALGAAFLAGLTVGFWESPDEVARFRRVDRVFSPGMEPKRREQLADGWNRAVKRAMNWVEN